MTKLMGRSAMSSSALAIPVVASLILFCKVVHATAAYRKPLSFSYFVHDDFVLPGVTAVQIVTSSGEFGDTTAFDSPLREGVNKTSPFIGYHSGISVALSKKGFFFISFTAELSTSTYSGTYTVQGRFDSTPATWILAITGGSGSFRGARGSVRGTVVVPDPVNGFVIRYDVDMFF